MRNNTFQTLLLAICGMALLAGTVFGQGTLTPPEDAFENGQPKATMKTLNQLEPRVIIDNLPFTISQPGSYYLVKPLIGVDNSNGVIITVSNVKLDLNGFNMNGPPNSLNGIVVQTNSQQPFVQDNITIRNGVLRGWGGYAVCASNAYDSVLEGVRVYGNGLGGIVMGANSMIDFCGAYGNGYAAGTNLGDGIQVTEYCTIKDCKSRKNKGAGINAKFACKITGSTSCENEQNGIFAEDYCTIEDCTVAWNKGGGITVLSKCKIVDNNCSENKNTNTLQGTGIVVEGNNNRIEDNSLTGNDYGIWVRGNGQGNLVVRNSASGNMYGDYMMSTNIGGDHYGQILEGSSLGEGFLNSNPWSNFRY